MKIIHIGTLKKKQTRHKREYIGKIGDNGEFIPKKSYAVRQELDKVVNQKNKRIITPSAKRTFYGATNLLVPSAIILISVC